MALISLQEAQNLGLLDPQLYPDLFSPEGLRGPGGGRFPANFGSNVPFFRLPGLTGLRSFRFGLEPLAMRLGLSPLPSALMAGASAVPIGRTRKAAANLTPAEQLAVVRRRIEEGILDLRSLPPEIRAALSRSSRPLLQVRPSAAEVPAGTAELALARRVLGAARDTQALANLAANRTITRSLAPGSEVAFQRQRMGERADLGPASTAASADILPETPFDLSSEDLRMLSSPEFSALLEAQPGISPPPPPASGAEIAARLGAEGLGDVGDVPPPPPPPPGPNGVQDLTEGIAPVLEGLSTLASLAGAGQAFERGQPVAGVLELAKPFVSPIIGKAVTTAIPQIGQILSTAAPGAAPAVGGSAALGATSLGDLLGAASVPLVAASIAEMAGAKTFLHQFPTDWQLFGGRVAETLRNSSSAIRQFWDELPKTQTREDLRRVWTNYLTRVEGGGVGGFTSEYGGYWEPFVANPDKGIGNLLPSPPAAGGSAHEGGITADWGPVTEAMRQAFLERYKSLPSAGLMSKFFAEQLRTVSRGPVEGPTLSGLETMGYSPEEAKKLFQAGATIHYENKDREDQTSTIEGPLGQIPARYVKEYPGREDSALVTNPASLNPQLFAPVQLRPGIDYYEPPPAISSAELPPPAVPAGGLTRPTSFDPNRGYTPEQLGPGGRLVPIAIGPDGQPIFGPPPIASLTPPPGSFESASIGGRVSPSGEAILLGAPRGS